MPSSKSTTLSSARPGTPPKPQPYIVIPGSRRPSSRRVASNIGTGIKALVIPDKSTHSPTLLKVSLIRDRRVLYHTLTGHKSNIVDLEFLQTKKVDLHNNNIHILGSCDRDGVVFLWFLYVRMDNLGNSKSLDLLKKYSFFTLRRSTTAFYNRIRLAGNINNGTMVLVPNDGANVRVISFHCQTASIDNIDHDHDHDHDININDQQPLITDGLIPLPMFIENNNDDNNNINNNINEERDIQGLDDMAVAARNSALQHLTFESEEHNVSSRSTINSSLAQARQEANAIPQDQQQQQQHGIIRQVVDIDVVRNEYEQTPQQHDTDYDAEIEGSASTLQQQQQLHTHVGSSTNTTTDAVMGSARGIKTSATSMTDALIVEGEGLAGYTRTL